VGEPARAPAREPEAGRADALPVIPGGFHGEGQVEIDAAPAQVWQAIIDPQSLRAVIPGCEHIEATGPESYRAAVRVSVAGIGGAYDVVMRLFDRHEPERLRLAGRALSRLGSGEGEAIVTLTALPAGRTRLTYRYVAAVGGKLAGFGQRMLDGVVRVLLASFFQRLAAHLRGEEQVAADRGTPKRLRDFLAMLRLLIGRS
jgi:2-furoyl-CoA dehydrogenase large subunit